jgi:plastocyanin
MVKKGMRAALIAVACGALVGIPALAWATDPPATGSFTAEDVIPDSGRWDANGDPGSSSLTVVSGGTVTFSYPSGMSTHSVSFTSAAKPACSGVPAPADYPGGWGPGWMASCRFDQPGRYTFTCPIHPAMTGTVTVEAAPTPTPSPGASPTPTPVYGATPTPTPTAMPTPQRTVKVTLPAHQQGRHVRGSVQVQSAHTRLEVTISAKLTGRKAVRVGHWLKRSAPAGRVAFAVPLIAPARHTLARRHKLAVTVRVALTPPGGRTLSHAAKATVKPG